LPIAAFSPGWRQPAGLHDTGLTLDEISMVQGALQDDVMARFRFLENPRMELVAAHARVAGRLEMAETALRTATPQVLTSIAARADEPYVSTGPVVPHTAVATARPRER
jgi:hypothetical protein